MTLFSKNANNKICSELNKNNFQNKKFFRNSGSGFFRTLYFPDFSDFLNPKFFESVAYIKHICRRIFEISQTVDLWRGMYYITSPLCHAHLSVHLGRFYGRKHFANKALRIVVISFDMLYQGYLL